jgi:hypothetical protein
MPDAEHAPDLFDYFSVHQVNAGSGPGTRSFTAENIQSVETTEIEFEPRYPIELSKVGELPENRYMFDPNKPSKAPKTSLRKRQNWQRPTAKYRYRCGFCGKTVTKSTQSPTLGPHSPGVAGHAVDDRASMSTHFIGNPPECRTPRRGVPNLSDLVNPANWSDKST